MSTTTVEKQLQHLKSKHESCLSVRESAKLLGITPRAIRRRCRLGDVDCVKVLGKWRIFPESIKRHLTGSDAVGRRYKRASSRSACKGTLSVAEAAEYLNVPVRTIQSWCKKGKLKATKRRGRWRIPKEVLIDALVYGTEDLT